CPLARRRLVGPSEPRRARACPRGARGQTPPKGRTDLGQRNSRLVRSSMSPCAKTPSRSRSHGTVLKLRARGRLKARRQSSRSHRADGAFASCCPKGLRHLEGRCTAENPKTARTRKRHDLSGRYCRGKVGFGKTEFPRATS